MSAGTPYPELGEELLLARDVGGQDERLGLPLDGAENVGVQVLEHARLVEDAQGRPPVVVLQHRLVLITQPPTDKQSIGQSCSSALIRVFCIQLALITG